MSSNVTPINKESSGKPAGVPCISEEERKSLKEAIIACLRTVYDPEIPVNIYDLGLIYGLDVTTEGQVTIQMTLTTPACPVAQTFPGTVENSVIHVKGVQSVTVDLVWDPPWSQESMSESAKLQFGLI